eukprot:scaffold13469_cov45-Prasinocladus_malaysianus.AAC.1
MNLGVALRRSAASKLRPSRRPPERGAALCGGGPRAAARQPGHGAAQALAGREGRSPGGPAGRGEVTAEVISSNRFKQANVCMGDLN